MVHFQLLLAFALSAAALALNPYELREKEVRPWRLESGRGREGLERERLLEREKLLERERLGRDRLDLERNIQRERIERERLGLERGIYGPIGLGVQERNHGHGNGLNEGSGYGLGPSYSLVPWVEPTKGVISNGHSGNVELQNKIVREVYSPAYIQPEYIVDYRFLRSGGRAYTRGPGGQIIILPRGVKEVDPSGHNSYDRLIEELQLEEEHLGRTPYRRVIVEGEGRGYRRDGLGERRGELGERRGELGERRGEPGERRRELEERRGEPGERRREFEERRGEFGERRRELGDRREELGERRGESGERRREFGERRGELGERRGELGERRGELFYPHGGLGERRGELYGKEILGRQREYGRVPRAEGAKPKGNTAKVEPVKSP